MSLAQLLLQRKRDKDQEYTLHLFEKCNLSCGFCWQDHTAMEGVDTVRDKAAVTIELMSKDHHDSFTVNVMGGELFDDSIFDDRLFNDYVNLCLDIHTYVVSVGKSVQFNLVSNLVTDQPHRVEALIHSMTALGMVVSLTTSYDVKGRFNRYQLEVFKSNIEYLRPHIACISMLLTKPVIKNIIAGRDLYFDYLYREGFYIYFDYYSPAEDHMVMMPSDKDLLRAFYYLIDNYPNVHPIKDWMQNNSNNMSCRTSKLVLADGTTCLCGNLIADNTHVIQFFKSKIERDDNDGMENTFLNTWDCINCEYFERCTLGCFTQHDFVKRGQLAECPFKLTFDKIVKGKLVDIDALNTTFG